MTLTVKTMRDVANRCSKEMHMRPIAAVKTCLTAMGVLVGLGIPSKNKKSKGFMGVLLLGGTYLPLVYTLASLLPRKKQK
ncbi:hypothetical protein SDC9_50007 [bioreactor metagenome]|uniref:Uncharacterized protein n=1 Tax=bioreactor metagenome TaxID=1076179 RepID=A0A644WJ16_9ZZZZ